MFFTSTYCRCRVLFVQMTFTSLRFTLAAAAFTPFLIKGWQDKRIRDAGLEVGMWTALG
jgi:Na+(H+)/acetate symporter ActP